MNRAEYISISKLSGSYQVDLTLFLQLDQIGLIEIYTFDQVLYIHQDKINDLERMLRLHKELEINLEGIDTIFNLLEKIDDLQAELATVKNKLRFYEEN